jgi:hypothetical protein
MYVSKVSLQLEELVSYVTKLSRKVLETKDRWSR